MEADSNLFYSVIIFSMVVVAVAGLLQLGNDYRRRSLAATPAAPPAVPACPRCGRVLQQGEKFCPGCGAATPAAPLVCASCETLLQPDHKFCPNCGLPSGRAAAPTLPEPAAASSEGEPAPARRSSAWLYILLGLALVGTAGWLLIQSLNLRLPGFGNLNRYPPMETAGFLRQASDESRQSYGLADIQLGGEQVLRYYREYEGDPLITALLKQWEAGDRIVNIYQFERKRAPQGTWVVVYGGRDEIVLGDDLVLGRQIGALGNPEARIRYILADAELGGVIEYYRQYTDDPDVAEAVRRWDAGVRVANLESFERIILGYAGWKVVYRGTTRLINANQIALTSDQPPSLVDLCSTGEGRIAYILADIQIGDVYNYYASHTSDPVVAEALRRWEAGVRLANLENFERRALNAQGWVITYAGSNQRVNCADLQLTQAAPPTPTPLAEGEWGVCNNPYYPTNAGSSWAFREDTSGLIVKSYSINDAMSNANGDRIYQISESGVTTWFRCDADGTVRIEMDRMIVPPPAAMFSDNVYTDPFDGSSWRIYGPSTVATPAGTFENCFSMSPYATDVMVSFTYCYGIGLTSLTWSETTTAVLDHYFIPWPR